MAKFRFRLTALQKLREAHRDEMRSKLAEAYQAERLLQEQIATAQQEERNLQGTQRGQLQQPTTDVNQLLNSQRYAAVLRSQVTTLLDQSKMLATEIEKRRQALVESDRQVRVLEKLHERQLDAHRNETLRAEIKVLDEVASRSAEDYY